MCFATAIQPESGVSSLPHTGASSAARTADAGDASMLRAARAFYCDALQGRQVWRMTCDPTARDSVCFVVAGTLIHVDPDVDSPGGPITLTVADPHELAERCWDAGFSVSVGDVGDSVPVFVFDPFGRKIELTTHEYVATSREITVKEGR